MPAIDLGLQRVAEGKQLAVFRAQLLDDGGDTGPECIGRDPGFGGRLLGDEIEQDRGDLLSVGIDTIHDGLSQKKWRFEAVLRRKAAKNAPKKGSVGRPFSPKAGSMRRPQKA
jgi:hypothetical protein